MAKNTDPNALKARAAAQPRKGGKFVKKEAAKAPPTLVEAPTATPTSPVPQPVPSTPPKASRATPTITPLPTPAKILKAPPPMPRSNVGANASTHLHMPLELKWGPFTIFRTKVYGGPYSQVPRTIDGVPVVGVKMAKEINMECDISIPTADFQVPPKAEFSDGLMDGILALLDGKTLYVGCMGGIGRTGTYMAGLAKVFGASAEHEGNGYRGPDVTTGPVGYVRSTYKSHALETPEQKAFIRDLDVEYFQRLLRDAARRRWIKRFFRA